jgi:formylmethanofuran dehydrogenase subunit E
MSKCSLSDELIQQTINFHGHSCPGLAIGIRAAELALAEIGHHADEEVVAVVETDMCGVDAIQFLTGCTFGKGNLIHLDYGKNVFTFYRRSDKKAVRFALRPEALHDPDDDSGTPGEKRMKEGLTPENRERLGNARDARKRRIMGTDLKTLFEVKPVQGPVPGKARILESLTCQACGESTMETRTRRFLGQTLCIPCFEAQEKR